MIETEVKRDNNLTEIKLDKKKNRNQTFNYLYVLAIIMVIDDHCCSKIGVLNNIFPYDSFFMPLFVFSSGYFFKRTKILTNIKHKIKRLFIPYILWNIVSFFLALIIDITIGTKWAVTSTIEQIRLTFIYSSLTSLNASAWFVIMLFWVSILYNIIRKFFKGTKTHDIVLSIGLLIIGLISTYLCTKNYASKGYIWIFILKISFYIQFYHFGYIFNKYVEKNLLKISKILVCSICIFINLILISKYGNNISFPSTAEMGKFKTWHLPIVTSFTGIIFYYEIMEFLSRKIGPNKVTDFISRNTFTIMEIHLLFINIPNFYIYLQKEVFGSTNWINFDSIAFIKSSWYRYDDFSNLIGFFCGLVGSLLVAFLLEKIKKNVNNCKNRFLIKKSEEFQNKLI